MRIFLYLLLLTILSPISRAEQRISIAYGDHNSPPYVIYDNNKRVVGGHFLELAKFLSEELNVDYRMVFTPRTRLLELLKSGHIDLYCNLNKKWVDEPSEFDWYPGLFEDTNILYTNLDKFKDIKKLSEVKETIGTITGFSYHPQFEKLISRVGRYDIKSHENLIKFLGLKRVGLIIMSKNIAENYMIKHKVNLSPVSSFRDSFLYQCIVSKKLQLDKNKLFKALDKFKSKM